MYNERIPPRTAPGTIANGIPRKVLPPLPANEKKRHRRTRKTKVRCSRLKDRWTSTYVVAELQKSFEAAVYR